MSKVRDAVEAMSEAIEDVVRTRRMLADATDAFEEADVVYEAAKLAHTEALRVAEEAQASYELLKMECENGECECDEEDDDCILCEDCEDDAE